MLISGLWTQVKQIAPFWIAGLVAGSIVSVFLSEKIAEKVSHIGESNFWLLPICISSLLGIISPLCMYGTIPVIVALGKKKTPQHILIAFMISSVLLNPNLFLMSFALGTRLALIRLGLSFLCGVLAGIIVLFLFQNKGLFCYEQFILQGKKKKKTFFADLFKAFRITAPYLLFGITLTTLCDRYIPQEWISSIFGSRRGLGVLFATTLSIPLYACGGGTIPLIKAWLQAGMGAGDALAFMIAGASLKINNLSAVKMIFSTKHFFFYVVYCLSFAILSGLFIEYILKRL